MLDHCVLGWITPVEFQIIEERWQNSATVGAMEPLGDLLLGHPSELARLANSLSERFHWTFRPPVICPVSRLGPLMFPAAF